ncbi:alpha/beta hydrolase [Spongisporangium articulatum]|uniref:Alpha/beta hydrolase n=1 Tax=Spongisporangium articulatum TaxID=3362603 RepID=A0ABW8AIZ5_9ACTN
MRSRRGLVAALGAVCLAVLCACSGGGPDLPVKHLEGAASPPDGTSDPARSSALERFYGQKVDWSDCEDGFLCASVVVPVDWAQPGGATLKMAVNRLPATGDSIGSLVVNPGGPGVSGLAFARSAPRYFGAQVREHYDIVGFDPRGVGASSGVKCLTDAAQDASAAEDSTPDTATELAAAVADAKSFGRVCEARTGALLGHVDTISVAKDLDVLRAVLGEDRLSFQGISYGTFIGAWYAELFPWRVGRMVLDGAVDPALSAEQYLEGQASGFSKVLDAYLKDCLDSSDCPLSGTVTSAVAQLGRLVDSVDANPLPTRSGRKLTQSLMTTGIVGSLYAVQSWPTLTEALTKAMEGDGSGLLAQADRYLERESNGHYSGDVVAANPAIFCLDSAEARTPEQIAVDARAVAAKYPPLGGSIAWSGLTCAEWPLKAVVPHRELHADGAPPILVVGTTQDPATPYAWAVSLATQLKSGRLLTWQGTVHTAYRQGSPCVDTAIETYLLSGDLPATGTRCR